MWKQRDCASCMSVCVFFSLLLWMRSCAGCQTCTFLCYCRLDNRKSTIIRTFRLLVLPPRKLLSPNRAYISPRDVVVIEDFEEGNNKTTDATNNNNSPSTGSRSPSMSPKPTSSRRNLGTRRSSEKLGRRFGGSAVSLTRAHSASGSRESFREISHMEESSNERFDDGESSEDGSPWSNYSGRRHMSLSPGNFFRTRGDDSKKPQDEAFHLSWRGTRQSRGWGCGEGLRLEGEGCVPRRHSRGHTMSSSGVFSAAIGRGKEGMDRPAFLDSGCGHISR